MAVCWEGAKEALAGSEVGACGAVYSLPGRGGGESSLQEVRLLEAV